MRRPDMTLLAIVAIASLAMLAGTPAASGADADRGRALYELGCGMCHSESVHGRKARVATDFEEIRSWVNRWNDNLHLEWSEDDVDSVSVYLNVTYYRYACPPQVCKVVSLGEPRRPRGNW